MLITPDISGKTARVLVREGQAVKAGDELFEIDPQPFRLALDQAEAKLAGVRTEFAILKSSLQSHTRMAELAQQNAEIKQRDLDRKKSLITSLSGSQADVDNAAFALVTAQTLAQTAIQRRNDTLSQLQGNPDLPIEQYPAFMQARAALEQAQRDLDHTLLRAPIDGVATQVDNIQLGRYVTAGTPVLAVIDTGAPWVDANPKETDITNLQIGQRAMVIVDTFPDQTFFGTVVSVSPGTGAQFAILPPQNAAGNWVKVVQRVPVRVQLDRDPDGEQAARRHERLCRDRHRPQVSARLAVRVGDRRKGREMIGAGLAARLSPTVRRWLVTVCAMTATIMQALELHGRERIAALYAGQPFGLARPDQLGAHLLHRRGRHHDGADGVAGRPLRAKARVHRLRPRASRSRRCFARCRRTSPRSCWRGCCKARSARRWCRCRRP